VEPVVCFHQNHSPVVAVVEYVNYLLGRRQETVFVFQEGNGTKKKLGMSDGLIIQCHGGGFVAQSSASHQVYNLS